MSESRSGTRDIMIFFGWFYQVAKKIFAISPSLSSVVILSILVAQLAVVIAFFLPLKVVMLLGSGSVPSYFEGVFPGMSFNSVVYFFIAMTLLFYVLSILATKLVDNCSLNATKKIIKSSHKLILFTNQDELATQLYQRVSNVVAGVLFFIIAMLFLLVVYVNLFLYVIIWSAFIFTVVFVAYNKIEAFRSNWNKNISKSVNQVSGLAFIVIFLTLSIDIMVFGGPGIYLGIACLLLVRQFIQRISLAVIDCMQLSISKHKVNALFSTDSSINSKVNIRSLSVMELLSENKMRNLVGEIASDTSLSFYLEDVDMVGYDVMQSSVIDVALVMFRFKNKAGGLVVKVYANRHQLLACMENDILLSEKDHYFPALNLIKVLEVDGCPVHIFEYAEPLSTSKASEFGALKDEFRAKLLSVKPDQELLEKYVKSHSLLHERILKWAHLLRSNYFLSSSPNSDFIDCLIEASDMISDLPLAYVCPDINADSLLVNTANDVVAIHWERWGIEPIGAGFSLKESETEYIQMVLDKAKGRGRDIESVDVRVVHLSALLSLLDTYIVGQKVRFAQDLIDPIVLCVREVESNGE